jgi:hypothetical protein
MAYSVLFISLVHFDYLNFILLDFRLSRSLKKVAAAQKNA